MNSKTKHIFYIVGLVISVISVMPFMPTVLKYLIAIFPVLLFGADLTLKYMQGFFNKRFINRNLAGILAGLGLIVTGKIGYAAITMLLFSASDFYLDMLIDISRRRIEDSSRVTAPYATVLANGKALRVSPASVVVGQTLVLREGDIIPCDCVAVSGEGLIDYTNIFGNGEPRNAKAGSNCFSGGIVQQGALSVRAVKSAKDSLNAVVNAYTKKASKPSKSQKTIEIISAVYEAAVYPFSFFIFLIFWLFTKDFALAVHQSAALLVLSSMISITKLLPLLSRNALLCGRRKGVIFTDIASLERCGNIKTVSANEEVSEDVLAMIEEAGAVPAKGGYTKDDAVLYRNRGILESDENPCFKLALGFFSPKAQATALDSKPQRSAGAVSTGRSYKQALRINLACIIAQKLAMVALIFLFNISPVTAVIIDFAACLFCLYNSTKEI
ncbi:MAG: hypothetical protein IKT46_01060 [Clostridia bacterium]|nr:hypothetical protein [Clostridia bacterium]